MRLARCLTLLAVLLVGATALAEEREVMLFRPAAGGFALDDLRLADAIRIHTRDVATGEPGAGGRLTVWYEGSRDKARQVTVTLYVQPPGQEERGQVVKVSVRGRLDDSLYRALALKVRAALVGDPTLPRVAAPPPRMVPSPEMVQAGRAESAPTLPHTPIPPLPLPLPLPLPVPLPLPLPSPSPSPSPSRTADRELPPDSPGVPAPRGATTPAPLAPVERYPFSSVALGALRLQRPLGFVIEAGPRLVLSDGTTRARLGGALVAALSVGTLYEVTLGFAFDQVHRAEGEEGTAEARVWPLFSSLRLLYRGERWTFGGGPRLGVSIVRASANADAEEGRTLGSATRVTATLGGETVVRWRLWRGLRLFALLSLDVHLTDVVVRIDLAPTLDTGRMSAAGFLGVAFTYP